MKRKTKDEISAEIKALENEAIEIEKTIADLNYRLAQIKGGFKSRGLIGSLKIELENADYPLVEYPGYYGDKQSILFVKQTDKRVYWRNVGSTNTTWTNKNRMDKEIMTALRELGLVD